MIYSYKDHPARTLIFDSNPACPRLSGGMKSEQRDLLHVAKLTRNHSNFDASVLLRSYAFCFLHKERSETLSTGASQQPET